MRPPRPAASDRGTVVATLVLLIVVVVDAWLRCFPRRGCLSLNASRDLRMTAADQIEMLLKVITNKANAKIESLTKVIDKDKK